ncbi:SdrD B-like domain-containing protein [uncultured Thiothrix sp.]|uniref:SdrD B-like domain-containing protein n=1 Tax=uncultured Thiothrix sp. TaxID=223185 RepID=UPI002622A141|nr:SdrD B-like domain-containing protein [uncultured Thiothrix sp.]
MLVPYVQADISGKVFRDFNSNGSFDSSASFNEVGMAGVTVKAFDTTGAQVGASVSSAADGTYTLTGLTAGADYRVEFSWAEAWLKSSVAGGSSVQFVKGNAINVNLAVSNPAEYCQANPKFATPRYVNGDPYANGTTATMAAWLRDSYDKQGTYTGTFDVLATTAQVGALWGEAFHRPTKTLFGAAVVRRHVSLGKINGQTTTGGIYKVNLSGVGSASPTAWLDVNQLAGVNTGADPRVEEGSSLPANAASPNHDPLAFTEVGKRGLGDIDISEDQKTLYAVNLYQRHLLSINIATKTLNTSLPIPNPGCSGDDYRPWAIGIHQGQVYIGTVCSAESSRSVTDLHAYIQRLDGASFINVYDFAMNYNRGNLGNSFDGDWKPWARTWEETGIQPNMTSGGATPILSDIQFDVDGSMVLGFLDRTGMQTGFDNYSTDTFSTDVHEVEAGGDLLRVCKTGSGWLLEGVVGCRSSAGTANGQGPAGFEYYFQDNFGGLHQELTVGGVALLPGSREVAVTAYDPLENYRTAGIMWMSNLSGQKNRAYELNPDAIAGVGQGTMGKAVGLGDLEFLCDQPPIEVGNRVWKDIDADGIQDAGEMGLAGVSISLTCPSGTVSTVTNAEGQFIFTNASGGNASFMQVEESCTLRIDNTQNVLKTYQLTTVNADNDSSNNEQSDLRDSDASMNGSYADIVFQTGSLGTNNHSLDFGYRELLAPDLALTKAVLPEQAKQGDQVIYTLTVTNQSTTTEATNVLIADQLPTGVTYVSDDGVTQYGNDVFDESLGIWAVGSIAAGATKTLKITVQIQ